jgi:hypothetical protein
MHSIEKGDVVKLHIGHQNRCVQCVSGTVTQYYAEYIRISVKSPAQLDVVTVASDNVFDEALTAYRDYSWVRMGSVDVIAIYKSNVANGDQLTQEMVSAYYNDEIAFSQLKALIGPEKTARFRLLKRQLSESRAGELAGL